MLRSLGLAAFLFSVAATSLARAELGAEPSPARIRLAAEAFDLGREAYSHENFVEAAEQFERADSQAPSVTAIEYAIRAREKAGQLERAATLAALAADRHPGDANIQAVVSDLLRRAERELFTLKVRCEEPCELALESTIVHGAPSFSRVVFLKAGTVLVQAGFPNGTSVAQSVSASAGGKGDVSFSVPAAAPAAPAPGPVAPKAAVPSAPPVPPKALPPERSTGLSPAVFWVGVGLTVAAAGVSTWSGLDTLNDPGEERIRAECPRGDTSCSLYQLGLEKQRRTNILFGVTGGLGLSTILLGALFTDWKGTDREPPASGASAPPRHARATLPKQARSVEWQPFVALGEGAFAGARGRF